MILGIDYGLKKIGLALAEGNLAEPLSVIKTDLSTKKIVNLCQENKVDKIVVGLPEGKIVSQVKKFAEKLGNTFDSLQRSIQ